ncbi:MAG: hypothetical protein JEZ06_21415 [Anaerolineaceae bacterium]|nr:hypothetical protein [Anaerolineaceae bacterium]
MIKTLPRLFSWLILVAAASLTLFEIFSLPSNGNKAWLLGLSPQRLVIALIPTICILLAVAILVLLLFFPDRYQNLMNRYLKPSPRAAMVSGCLCFWIVLFLGSILKQYYGKLLKNYGLI